MWRSACRAGRPERRRRRVRGRQAHRDRGPWRELCATRPQSIAGQPEVAELGEIMRTRCARLLPGTELLPRAGGPAPGRGMLDKRPRRRL